MSTDIKTARPEFRDHANTGGSSTDAFESENGAISARSNDRVLPRRAVAAPELRNPARPRSMVPVVLIVILGNILLFLGGGLAGWSFAKKDPPRTPPPAQVIMSPVNNEVARSIDSKASRDEVSDLKREVGSLEVRIRAMQEQLVALSGESARLKQQFESRSQSDKASAGPSVDLKGLESRIDGLVEMTGKVTSLPADLRTLAKSVERLDGQLAKVQSEVAGLPKKFEKAVATPPQAPAPKPESKPSAADEARAKGSELFREGRFVEARDLFVKQTTEAPDDARSWYYAALANGFATNNWGDETIRLVTRGVERERAGTPPRAEIDTAFSAINQPQGREWLQSWRQRAATR